MLPLLCSEDEFYRTRARIRMQAGFTALQLVEDEMVEATLWHASTPERAALDRKAFADARHFPASDRVILGC
jgi:hypothetical protein